jgi:hypothetical protein
MHIYYIANNILMACSIRLKKKIKVHRILNFFPQNISVWWQRRVSRVNWGVHQGNPSRQKIMSRTRWHHTGAHQHNQRICQVRMLAQSWNSLKWSCGNSIFFDIDIRKTTPRKQNPIMYLWWSNWYDFYFIYFFQPTFYGRYGILNFIFITLVGRRRLSAANFLRPGDRTSGKRHCVGRATKNDGWGNEVDNPYKLAVRPSSACVWNIGNEKESRASWKVIWISNQNDKPTTVTLWIYGRYMCRGRWQNVTVSIHNYLICYIRCTKFLMNFVIFFSHQCCSCATKQNVKNNMINSPFLAMLTNAYGNHATRSIFDDY